MIFTDIKNPKIDEAFKFAAIIVAIFIIVMSSIVAYGITEYFSSPNDTSIGGYWRT